MQAPPSAIRSIGMRFLTPLGHLLQVAAREDEAWVFVEWGPGLPARRCRVAAESLWDLLEGATLLGREAEA